MADNVEVGFEFNDAGLEGFDNFVDRLEQLEKKLESLSGDGFDKVTEGAKELDDEIEELVTDVTKLEKENKKLTETNNEASKSFIESAKNTKVFGVSLNDIKGKLVDFRAGLVASSLAAKSATAGTTGFSKGLKVLKVALVGTGIGAIVVALGSLIAFLSTTQRGIDAVTTVTRPLTALFERSIGIIQDLGGSLFDAFSNPLETLKSFGGAVVSFITNPLEGVKNLLGGIVSAARNTGEFVKESLAQGAELDRLQKEIEVTEIAAKTRREELNRIAKEGQQLAQDISKSEKEREEAAIQAIAAIKERGEIDIDLLNKRIAKKELEHTLNDTSRADELELAGLKAQAIRAEADSIQQTTRLNNNLNSVRTQAAAAQKKAADERQKAQEEEIKRIEALNKAFEDQVKIFQDQVDAVITANSSEAEKLEFIRQKAIDDLLTLEKMLITTAQAAGKSTSFISEGIETLIDDIEAQYSQGIDRLNARDTDLLVTLTPKLGEGLNSGEAANLLGLDVFGNKIGEQEGEAFVLSFKDQIDKFISEDLGLDDDDIAQLSSAVNQVFSTIQSGVLANTAAQIEAQDELINKLNDRVNATESALERELKLKLAGYANDYDALKNNLSDQNALVDAAEKEKTRLKKKQLEQQLIFDEIAQASALTTAVAQIIESTSGIPIVGIVLAGLAIASMVALFDQYKSQVNSLSGLREGLNPSHDRVERSGGRGFKIKGRSHEQGGEIYRQNGTIWEAEKDEILIGTKASIKHDKFLFNLNKGMYDDLGPLDELLSNKSLFNHLSDKTVRPGANVVTVINQNKFNANEIAEAIEKGNVQVIEAINKTTGAVNRKSEIIPLQNGDLLEIIYNNNGDKIVSRTIERDKDKTVEKLLKKLR